MRTVNPSGRHPGLPSSSFGRDEVPPARLKGHRAKTLVSHSCLVILRKSAGGGMSVRALPRVLRGLSPVGNQHRKPRRFIAEKRTYVATLATAQAHLGPRPPTGALAAGGRSMDRVAARGKTVSCHAAANGDRTTPKKEPRKRCVSKAFPVRPRGLEPPRTIRSTRPST